MHSPMPPLLLPDIAAVSRIHRFGSCSLGECVISSRCVFGSAFSLLQDFRATEVSVSLHFPVLDAILTNVRCMAAVERLIVE